MAWLNNRIHARFLHRMPVKEADVVQIAPGRMNFRTMEIWGRNVFILKIMSSAYGLFTARPYDGWIGLLVPVSWRGIFRLNGCVHRPDNVYYLDGTHDYTVACQDSVRILVGVRRNMMEAALIKCTQTIDEEFLYGSRIFENSAECAIKLERLISSLRKDTNDPADTVEGLNLSVQEEWVIVEQMAHWLAEKMENPTPAWIGQIDDYRITTEIRDALKVRSPDETVRLSDLYAIADVGKNRLHQSFVRVYGVPPARYLSMRRLWAARQFLLDPKNSGFSLKEVASQFGYPSSGRFAEKYRRTFEELPSDTVKSARSTLNRT